MQYVNRIVRVKFYYNTYWTFYKIVKWDGAILYGKKFDCFGNEEKSTLPLDIGKNDKIELVEIPDE